ncbi:serine/threonine protein kinase [bacterium]|nr:serine/threonine protein kinase [bacterium]MDC0278869.1 serine/threonine protein kinase [bacterium]
MNEQKTHDCPTINELRHLLNETLASDHAESISIHVQECEGCQERLELLSDEAMVNDPMIHDSFGHDSLRGSASGRSFSSLEVRGGNTSDTSAASELPPHANEALRKIVADLRHGEAESNTIKKNKSAFSTPSEAKQRQEFSDSHPGGSDFIASPRDSGSRGAGSSDGDSRRQRSSNRSSQALSFPEAPMTEKGIGAIGRYEVLRRIASGASGVLYEAWDSELDRPVALKILRDLADPASDAYQRMTREARTASALRHENIVPVYEFVSRDDFPPLLVMKLLSGQTLSDITRIRQTVDAKEAARLVMQAALGLASAHQAGLVHRDVKPSNLLLDDSVDPPTVLVADFGLVHEVSSQSDLTRTGDLAGTPAYMSPEQIDNLKGIDSRSDIYSLGCVLYQLITGQPPFTGTVRMVLWQIIHEDPIAPRRMDERIPKSLENICLKAMSKDRRSRYSTATEFAADLQSFLQGQRTIARPVSFSRRTVRLISRHRVAATGLIATGLLFISIAGISSFAAVRLKGAQTEVQLQAARAAEDRDIALKAMETIVFQAYDELDSETYDSDEIQIKLLKSAAKGLARMNSGADEQLLEYQAEMHSRLGQALYRMNRFHPALDELSTAEKRLSSMSQEKLALKEIRFLKMRTMATKARVLYQLDDNIALWPVLMETIPLADDLLREFPSQRALLLEVAEIHQDYAYAIASSESEAAALDDYERTLELHLRAGPVETLSFTERLTRLQMQLDLADSLFDTKDVDLAIREYRRLKAIAQKSISMDQQSEFAGLFHNARAFLVESANGEAWCLFEQGKVEQALQTCDEGWQEVDQYMDLQPEDQDIIELAEWLVTSALVMLESSQEVALKRQWAMRAVEVAENEVRVSPGDDAQQKLEDAQQRLDLLSETL